MSDRFHFISGLPRSGSTLLGAILAQNPRFRASMSSPVGSIVQNLVQSMSVRNQWSPLVDFHQRRRLLKGIFQAYYHEDGNERLVFDTNRLWCARLPLLAELFDGARIIVCVREAKWVINSFERIFQSNPLLMSRLFTNDQAQTVYSRVDSLTAADGTFGFAYRALKEAYYGEHSNRIILIDYDAFVADPRGTVNIIYDELEQSYFNHDFENIAFDGGDAFDVQFGLPGLHRIEPSVRPSSRRMLLPPDIVQRFTLQDFWRRTSVAGSSIRAVLPEGCQSELV